MLPHPHHTGHSRTRACAPGTPERDSVPVASPAPFRRCLWPRRPGWWVRAPRPRRPTLRQPQRRTAPRPARRCPGAVPVPIPAPAAARLRTRSGAAPRLPEDRSGAAPRRVQSGSPSTSRCRTGASSPPKTLFRRGSPWSTSQTARPSPAYSLSFHLHASSTWSPLAASHPSTDQAPPCVASEIRRRRACPGAAAADTAENLTVSDCRTLASSTVPSSERRLRSSLLTGVRLRTGPSPPGAPSGAPPVLSPRPPPAVYLLATRAVHAVASVSPA